MNYHPINSKISLVIICAFFLSFGCSQSRKEEPVGEFSEMYGLIYDAVATRSGPGSVWYEISGLSSFAIEPGDDDTKGSFYLSYANYNEPQFCAIGQTCDCSGTVQAIFNLSESDTETTSESVEDKTWNIFDPYTSPSPENTTEAETGQIYQIYTYVISLDVTANDLIPSCRPQSDRSLYIIRYYSGDVIVQDTYREILYRPRRVN